MELGASDLMLQNAPKRLMLRPGFAASVVMIFSLRRLQVGDRFARKKIGTIPGSAQRPR